MSDSAKTGSSLTPGERAERAFRVVEAERRGIRIVPDDPGPEFKPVRFGCLDYPECKARCNMPVCMQDGKPCDF